MNLTKNETIALIIESIKLRYRGPRVHGTQQNCVLRDATTFAVYPR